jgi:hypothetical protein
MNALQISPSSVHDLITRIRGEFLEMPGLKLSREQARRLWALDAQRCDQVLDALVDLQFLVRRADGQYIRSTEGGWIQAVDATVSASISAGVR